MIGSATRNELTQVIDENGFIISDIEILVILKRFFPFEKKKRKVVFSIGNYKIEILFTHLIFLKILKTPLVYDLKTSGKVLWGNDIRKSIWLRNAKDIPYWEGIRLIYNRLIPFEVLIWKHLNHLEIKKNEEYTNTKLLIAIGEYLMIKNKNYITSYKDKLQYFEDNFNQNQFITLIVNALKYKLNLNSDYDNLVAIDHTAILVCKILKHINPKLKKFKVPLSIKIIDIIKKVQNRNFNGIFKNLEIFQIYNCAFNLLMNSIDCKEKFLKSRKKINMLYKKWENCLQIQSSYI